MESIAYKILNIGSTVREESFEKGSMACLTATTVAVANGVARSSLYASTHVAVVIQPKP